MDGSFFVKSDEWIGAEGTRLQRGSNGRLRPLKRCEEAQAPSRGKRVPAAERNGDVQKDLPKMFKNQST